MVKNFFKAAFRNMAKNKLNTLIIILGLGTSIAFSILSFLFIHDEFAFDRFHKNIDKIYEMKMVLALPTGRAIADPKSHIALELNTQFPEIVQVVRMEKSKSIVKRDDETFEQLAIATDPAFFDMFTFPFKNEAGKNALAHPDSVVLTESTAKKYFGEEDAEGRVLSIRIKDEFQDYVVTGVLEDIPENSSLQFDFLINLERVYGVTVNDPQKSHSMSFFILLADQSIAELLLQNFKTSIDGPLQERFSKDSGYDLQALADFHLRGEFGSEVLSHKSTISYSYILAGISLLILTIACFNFINLSIGKASNRLKEIGVRKVCGAKRKHLIVQFGLESLMHSFASLAVALMMDELFLPVFNRLSQKSLKLNVFSNEWTLVFCAGAVLFVGIVAGSYPALFLSRFASVDLFRGKMKLSRKSAFSGSLIVFQFAISIFLIVSTIFMYKQKTYMLNSDLGYKSDQVVVLSLKNLDTGAGRNAAFVSALKNKLLSYDMIHGVSGSAYDLSEGWMGTYFDKFSGEQELVLYNYIDQDFIPTLGVRLLAGRNFSYEFPSDFEGSVIVNKSFTKMLGVESPVGHKLSEFFKTDFDRRIIGVVEDFHSESLHNPVYPAFMGMSGVDFSYVFIKLGEGNLREGIANIKKEFRALAPQMPFAYSFLDEDVARLYDREEHWIRLVEYACLFAIFIACSGLFGLTLQVIFLRTKEIGVRKVLGASVRNLVLLINREFIWLVLAANILAWPAAYIAMSVVLRNYAFRISLAPWVFVIAGLLALVLAAATISIHALQAANTNPSEILRYE